ncbi:hypothetical protein [Streptomyces sp. NPDC102462]
MAIPSLPDRAWSKPAPRRAARTAADPIPMDFERAWARGSPDSGSGSAKD